MRKSSGALLRTGNSPGADEASFWGTLYQGHPYKWTPAYSLLEGFDMSMVFPDLLHVWHLGVARDLIGGAMRTYMDFAVWGAGNEQTMLEAPTSSLKDFCRSNQLPLKLSKLTKRKLTLSRTKYPELRSSGYDAYVVLLWLMHEAQRCPTLPDLLKTCMWAGNHALSILCNGGHFLTSQEQNNVQLVGLMFVRCYLLLARQALDANRKLYRIRPKFHLLHHCFRSPFATTSRTNHGAYATWMDEDSLKKLMKIMSETDKRTAERRLLQRWLLSLPGTWRRVRKTIKKLSPRLLCATVSSQKHMWQEAGFTIHIYIYTYIHTYTHTYRRDS